MAATRCAGLVFKRVYCMPLPASSMDCVPSMVAVDTMDSGTEVASDVCFVCDTPEFSTSSTESCSECGSPEFPTTPSREVDATSLHQSGKSSGGSVIAKYSYSL